MISDGFLTIIAYLIGMFFNGIASYINYFTFLWGVYMPSSKLVGLMELEKMNKKRMLDVS